MMRSDTAKLIAQSTAKAFGFRLSPENAVFLATGSFRNTGPARLISSKAGFLERSGCRILHDEFGRRVGRQYTQLSVNPVTSLALLHSDFPTPLIVLSE
jgi:hypothetical protein